MAALKTLDLLSTRQTVNGTNVPFVLKGKENS